MKNILRQIKVKEKICTTCGLQKSCGELPGFCALVYFLPAIFVVIMLLYFYFTMNL